MPNTRDWKPTACTWKGAKRISEGVFEKEDGIVVYDSRDEKMKGAENTGAERSAFKTEDWA